MSYEPLDDVALFEALGSKQVRREIKRFKGKTRVRAEEWLAGRDQRTNRLINLVSAIMTAIGAAASVGALLRQMFAQ